MQEPLSIFKMINLKRMMITRPLNASRSKPQACLCHVHPSKEQIHFVITECGVYLQLCSLSAVAHPKHTNLYYVVKKILNKCKA